MMAALHAALGGWIWWLIGLALLGVEVLAPGYFFLWFGVAALVIGAGALVVDWPGQTEVVGFAVLSVVAAVLGRRLTSYADTASDDPFLNARAERLAVADIVIDNDGPIEALPPRVRTVWEQLSGQRPPAG